MPKISRVDRAIASLEADIHVLQMAIARLKAEQASKPARVRKPKPIGGEPAGSSR